MTTTTRSQVDPRNQRGFTLTELIVASALSGFLLVAVLSSFLYISRSGQTLAAYSDLESNGRQALETFALDVREAERVNWHSKHSLTLFPASGGTAITYTYDPERRGLYRTAGASPIPPSDNTSPLLRSVSDLVFTGYTLTLDNVSKLATLETEQGRALAGRITKHLELSFSTGQAGPPGTPAASRKLSARTPLLNRRVAS